jgi:hypothetical protein
MQVGSGKPLPFAISLSNFSFPWKTKKKKIHSSKMGKPFLQTVTIQN